MTYPQSLVRLAEAAAQFANAVRETSRVASETQDSEEHDAKARATVAAIRMTLLEALNDVPAMRAAFIVPPLR